MNSVDNTEMPSPHNLGSGQKCLQGCRHFFGILWFQALEKHTRSGLRGCRCRKLAEIEIKCQDEAILLDGPGNMGVIRRALGRLARREGIMACAAQRPNRFERDVLVGEQPYHAAPGRTVSNVWSCRDSAAYANAARIASSVS